VRREWLVVLEVKNRIVIDLNDFKLLRWIVAIQYGPPTIPGAQCEANVRLGLTRRVKTV